MPASGDANTTNGAAGNAVVTAASPELDEWGLPVRKSEPPQESEQERESEGYVQSKVAAIEEAESKSVQSTEVKLPAEKKIAAMPTLQVPSQAETDSEGDDFEDAPSTPQPATPLTQLQLHQSAIETKEQEPEAKEPEAKPPRTESLETEPSKTEPLKTESPQTELPKAALPKAELPKAGHPNAESPSTPEVQDQPSKSAQKSEVEDAVPALEEVRKEDVKASPESISGPSKIHRRDESSNTNGISEWSHQQLAPKEEKEEKVEEDEWQVMPAFAPFDMYDDDNRLIAREAVESDDEAAMYSGLGGAGKGYTRVQLDEDAQSATSLDENTQYLFKEVNTTSAAGLDDDEQRDAVSQMQATKDLLTEGQRIAYVGMTRLALSNMVRQAQRLEGLSKGTKKDAVMAAEATLMWSQKMMVRLYAHMDISTAEQIMIEQLADHGVEPRDLTPTLMQNARVKNPMADENAEKESLSTPLTSPRHSSVGSVDKSSRSSISSPRIRDEESASPPPAYQEHDGEDLPEVRTPSQLGTAKNIDIDLRWTVLCDLFLTLIADSIYDARSRVLLERVGGDMEVSWLEICRFEKRVTDALEMQQAAEKENWNEDDHKETRRKNALKKRYMMMGLATVGGSLVIGLSAGLLAPVIGAGLAAGFTTIGVAGTGGFLAGAGGAAIITSAAATSGGVIAVRAANRRTGAVKTFEYRPLHNNKRVNLIVTVSGWMTGKIDDVRLPYSTVDPIMGDIYSVLWEPEMLQSMGDTINILATEALTQGLQQVLGSTILIGLMAALQLPVVLTKLAYLIDNPWTVSLDRANAAGLILADSLIDRNLGTRPITFVGYSLGSRVIFSCLRELAKKGAYGLVQNVYLFGSPIVAKKDEYIRARAVVAGRFVNGYASNDWILGYLFRLTSGGISRVAGLAPVEDVPGIENVNVTELVPGHMAYRTAMPKLLRQVGWEVESDEFSEIEDPDPENHEKRQRELINEIEEARKEFERKEKEAQGKGKFGFFGLKKKKAMEKKEWETYQESKGGEYNEGSEERKHEGVLFDVDAIRRELAAEHMEVKELKSTLPPMKLDLSATPPRNALRETRSHDASTLPISSNLTPFEASPGLSRTSRDSVRDTDRKSLNPYSSPPGEIRMSFDNSYHSPALSAASLHKYDSPPIAEPNDRSAAIQRPELKSSTTMPAALPAMSPDLNHNAWADDDDEFREKEMEMSFA